ncbi:MAG: hypothetical protein ABSG69_10275 [Candidatus Acidiferrum sp.]|jgi:hypothetical protein
MSGHNNGNGNGKRRLALNGLDHFCRRYSTLLTGDRWEVPYRSPATIAGLAARFADVMRCDLAYSYTGRITMGKFLRVARSLGKTKIIMVWCGSDSIFAQAEYAMGKIDPWVTQLTHWSISPWLAEEVCSLGVNCEYVPATQFVDLVPNPKPLPEKFSVLMYVRDINKGGLYGWDRMEKVARALPHIEFNLFGLVEGQTVAAPPNVKVHSWTSGFTPFLEQSTVVYRPVRHDGLSLTVLEALSHGRHVVWTYPLEGCIHAPTTDVAREELQKLYIEHQSGNLGLNEVGIRYVTANHGSEFARAELLRRFEQIMATPS